MQSDYFFIIPTDTSLDVLEDNIKTSLIKLNLEKVRFDDKWNVIFMFRGNWNYIEDFEEERQMYKDLLADIEKRFIRNWGRGSPYENKYKSITGVYFSYAT